MRFPFSNYQHRVCATKYGLQICHLKLWLYCISQVKCLDSQEWLQVTLKNLNRRCFSPWVSTWTRLMGVLGCWKCHYSWDFKRRHMFLLVLKDPIDLDKLIPRVSAYLASLCSFNCLFPHPESWTCEQLFWSVWKWQCFRSGQWLIQGEAWARTVWDPVILGSRTACICTCGYALYSVALLLKLHQLLLQQTGDNIPVIHGAAQHLSENHSSCWGKMSCFHLSFQLLA